MKRKVPKASQNVGLSVLRILLVGGALKAKGPPIAF